MTCNAKTLRARRYVKPFSFWLTAHIDERLVGIMIDALHELLIVVTEATHGDDAPSTNSRILSRRQQLMRARSGSGEVRYLTESMNSETY
jgi:hypothetical protein